MEVIPCGSQDEPVNLPKLITRKELYLLLKTEKMCISSSFKCQERLLNYILATFNVEKCTPQCEKLLKASIRSFTTKLTTKWKQCHRTHNRMMNTHSKWLDAEFKIPQIQQIQPTPEKSPYQGRPRKDFVVSSLRSKQRNVQKLVETISPEQLTFATKTSLIRSGRRKTAKVVELALDSSPKSSNRMHNVRKGSEKPITAYTPEEALAMLVNKNMTKMNYIEIQRGAKERGANIYPAYNVIAQAKEYCYPNNVVVSEMDARIPMQDILNHTTKRLVMVQREVLLLYLPSDSWTVDIFYKWGLDGSGGHSIYKQQFVNHPRFSDSNIILCTIVPLEISLKYRGKKLIFWKNHCPSSTRYCRPICFKLVKETNETIKVEYDIINQQVQNLLPTNIELTEEKMVQFNHILVCTMMDGKTCNVLTETTSTQSCNICKITPKDINDMEKVLQQPCDISALRFGISVLHSYLRCFEFLLHISYKLKLRTWQARGAEAKGLVKEEKKKITDLFYEKLSLVVDQPKQGGGNTNDGNTARKFFDYPEIAAEVTGLDENLVRRFSNILKAISSCHYLNIEVFKPYCLETAKLCIDLYGWYKMSASVHKLLIHGSDIIHSLPLPVGQLSEDVLETSQKEYKNIRLFHSRKTSRENCNLDILHWMLVNSDPVITSKRRKATKNKRKPINEEVKSMLTIPSNFESTIAETSDTSDNGEDDDDRF